MSPCLATTARTDGQSGSTGLTARVDGCGAGTRPHARPEPHAGTAGLEAWTSRSARKGEARGLVPEPGRDCTQGRTARKVELHGSDGWARRGDLSSRRFGTARTSRRGHSSHAWGPLQSLVSLGCGSLRAGCPRTGIRCRGSRSRPSGSGRAGRQQASPAAQAAREARSTCAPHAARTRRAPVAQVFRKGCRAGSGGNVASSNGEKSTALRGDPLADSACPTTPEIGRAHV